MNKSFITKDFSYEFFKPKPWKLFLDNFQQMNLRKYLRFLSSSLAGSEIYYMKNKANTVIGYCLLEGKGWRYPFAGSSDYIISPYVIKEEFRGMGLGTQLLKDIVRNIKFNGKIFAMVKKNNISSIKAMEKAGFQIVGQANIVGIRRIYTLVDKNADFYVFEYRKNKGNL